MLVTGTTVLGLCLNVSAAQDQTPRFRTGIDTVEVIAVVRDRQGNPVRGLTREDFAVEENGVAQDISTFAVVNLPQSEPAADLAIGANGLRPDVTSNRVPAHRSYVLVLDAQHVDPLRSGRVRELAKKFINEHLYEGDMAAVLTLGTGIRDQDFTSDRLRLIAAVDAFVGGKSGSAAVNKLKRDRDYDHENAVKAFDAQVLFDSVRRICNSLGAVTSTRRAVVLFSEGVEIDVTDLLGANPTTGGAEQIVSTQPSTYAGELLAAQKAMLDAAERSNVALYTVDPRGSTTGAQTVMEVGGLRPGTVPPTLDVLREVQRSQGSLRLFADQTGGLAIVNSNDFDRGFKQVVDANSAYYVLGYTPWSKASGFRKIQVRVARNSVSVTARPGYFSDAPVVASASTPQTRIPLAGASTRMQDLLANPLRQAGLNLRATAASLAVSDQDRVVAIVAELDGAALSSADQGGMLSSDIEVGLIAYDRVGKVRWYQASAGTVRFPETKRSGAANGLRLILEAPLPPDEYQVRLAVIERIRGLAGSVVLDVDLRRAANPVTALLFLQEGDDVPTSGNAAVLKSLLPATPPTTKRCFSTSQRLSVFAALSPSSTAARPIEVTLVVIHDDGSDAVRLPPTAAVGRQVGKASTLGALMTVPMDALAPGSYRLYVNVHDGRRTMASAPVAFSVEAVPGDAAEWRCIRQAGVRQQVGSE